ncbi:MAG: hypothetical protein HY515_03095 [Candidatus Aenigmarchaeota archaeon]|nr:hypothetical protein [Candidatus Aenigmarchaeota archaeon]
MRIIIEGFFMNDGHEERLQRFRVLDIETMQSHVFPGYTNGSGRTFVDTGKREERVSYVNLGEPFDGVVVTYVFRSQLKQDPGLYNFNKRLAGVTV